MTCYIIGSILVICYIIASDLLPSSRLRVVDNRIDDVNIGVVILRKHKVVSPALGCSNPPATFVPPNHSECFVVFPMMEVNAPVLLAEKNSSAKLISTEALGMSHSNRLFINDET